MYHLSELSAALAAQPALNELAAALAGRPARLRVAPLLAAARAPLAAALARRHPAPILFVAPSGDAALRAADDLRQWLAPDAVLLYPASDSLPYEHMSPGPQVLARRLRVLGALSALRDQGPTTSDQRPAPASQPVSPVRPSSLIPHPSSLIIVAPVKALLQPTLTPAELARATIGLRRGQELRPDDLLRRLVDMGYRHAPTVEEPGELARRGDLIDIWPSADEQPLRVELFGDEIDNLRRFDPATQRSEGRVESAEVGPPHEIPLWNRELALARIAALTLDGLRRESRAEWEEAIGRLEAGERFEGRAFYGPFFRQTAGTLLDHLPPGAAVLLSEAQFLAQHAAEIHEQAEAQRARLIETAELPPDFPRPYLLWEELIAGEPGSPTAPSAPPLYGRTHVSASDARTHVSASDARTHVSASDAQTHVSASDAQTHVSASDARTHVSASDGQTHVSASDGQTHVSASYILVDLTNNEGEGQVRAPAFAPAELFGGQFRRLIADIVERLANGERVVAVTSQAARLQELVDEAFRADAQDAGAYKFSVVHGALDGGWRLPELNVTLYSDAEIFGIRQRRPLSERRKKPRGADERAAFVRGLKPGDYVVHIEHGIAVYEGLIHRTVGEIEREYLVLRYAAGDKIYVPVDQVDRVTRYIGTGDGTPTLTRLGTQEWERAKRKARAAVQDLAEDLLKLYAQRQLKQGHAFAPDNEWQHELEAAFPYLETEDQMRAIGDVKADMEQTVPMDRLICGDVGFGKTEVAIRAAFKAVQDGHQVAVLVPTTVLAQQHFDTFTRRMGAFPITIEMLSRFRTPKAQDAIVSELARGRVDIVIGTHRILSKDVRFKDLGLVVVDEEQRFGVRHKERLKQLRAEVDVLTLTATPIPRTLHMAMAGIRDLSVIDTPPEDRVPIKTYVMPYDEQLVREAILREVEREGQIYFVHNRVHSIYHVANRLKTLVPEVSIGVGHGQLEERELERVMLEFFEGRYDVLVCTTIIESGLDVPNANTIIIDDATNYGLAQLYQLRGRVGRSANRAYAYLLYRQEKPMTPEAQARLEAIQEATELGAGFRVAMRDLEIRGAGNLLGAEQSGHIAAVGFDLYSRLLEQAVKQLKAGVDAEREGDRETRRQGDKETDGEGSRSPGLPVSLSDAASKLVISEKILVSPLVTLDLPLTAYLPPSYVADERVRLAMYQRMVEAQSVDEVRELRKELQDRFGPPPEEAMHLLTWLQIKALALQAGVSSVVTASEEFVIRLPILDAPQREKLRRRFGRDPAVKVGPQFIRLDRRAVGDAWSEKLVGVLEVLAA